VQVVGAVEEVIAPVAETPVERAVRPSAQTVPSQLPGLMDKTTTTAVQLQAVTTTTAADTTTIGPAVHGPIAPSVVPVEPMPSPVPGVPSPYHAVDFCVPVGPDSSLVTGLLAGYIYNFCSPNNGSKKNTKMYTTNNLFFKYLFIYTFFYSFTCSFVHSFVHLFVYISSISREFFF